MKTVEWRDKPVWVMRRTPEMAAALLGREAQLAVRVFKNKPAPVGTLSPPLMANAAGHADHGLAVASFWAMSTGFVRGVGFLPLAPLWRCLFSGWSCAVALALAALLKFLQ